jgi:hypothetical protein
MIPIRGSQLAALEDEQQDSYLERVRSMIESSLKRPVHREHLQRLFARGQTYGLVSEREFARYLFVAAASNAGAVDADPPWIADIMNDGSATSATRKLQRLFAAAEIHLADVVARRLGQ